jgi:hypothetical protein
MSNIDWALEAIKAALEEVRKHDNAFFKVSVDKDAGVLRIYGEDSHPIKRASSGLGEVMELAYTTAEHHPYWALLYNATEISRIVLDRWEAELSDDQMSEISWRCDEIKMALERFGK